MILFSFIFIIFTNAVSFVLFFVPCHVDQRAGSGRSVCRGKYEEGNLKPLAAIGKGGGVHDPVMIQDQENVVDVHHRLLSCREVKVVSSPKVFVDVLQPISKDMFLGEESTYIIDICSDLRVQTPADTSSVKHSPHPPVFVERTFLSHAVMIQYPIQEGHDVLFGAVLKKG
jgi:hypothetical protein